MRKAAEEQDRNQFEALVKSVSATLEDRFIETNSARLAMLKVGSEMEKEATANKPSASA